LRKLLTPLVNIIVLEQSSQKMQPIGTSLYYEKAFSKAGRPISSTVEHIEVDWQLASWHLSTV
jgi:hypothetical protein